MKRKKETTRSKKFLWILKWIVTIGLEIILSGASININFMCIFADCY